MKIMLPMSLKADEMNKNNVTYTKKAIEKAVEEFNSKEIRVVTDGYSQNTVVDMARCIGTVESITKNEDGYNCHLLLVDSNEEIINKLKLHPENYSVGTFGYGSVTKTVDNISLVEDLNILSVAILPKEELA